MTPVTRTLKINISTLVNDLNIIADNLEKIGVWETEPYQLFVFVTKLKTTNIVIKCFWCPESIRLRIKKLEKMSVIKTNILNIRVPDLKRSRYSKEIAERFIKDKELDNYKSYRELYGLRS